jgi:hypothetical protein
MWSRFKTLPVSERVLVAVLFLTAALGASTAVRYLLTALSVPTATYALVQVLGIAAAGSWLYRPKLGIALSLLFYLPQLLSYAGPHGHWNYLSGTSITLNLVTGDGAANWELNVLALVLFSVTCSRLLQRQPPNSQKDFEAI